MHLHTSKLFWLSAGVLIPSITTAQFNYYQCTDDCQNSINACTQEYADAGQKCGAVCGTYPCDYRNDGCTNPKEQACVKSCQAITGDCQDPYDSCMAGCDNAAQAACLEQCEDGVNTSCTWSREKAEAIYQLAEAACAAAQSVGEGGAICNTEDHSANDYYKCTQDGYEDCETSCASGSTQKRALEERCTARVETHVKAVTRGSATHFKTITKTIPCHGTRTTSTTTSTSPTCTPTQPVCGGAAAGIDVFAKALMADGNPGFKNVLALARNITAGCAAYC